MARHGTNSLNDVSESGWSLERIEKRRDVPRVFLRDTHSRHRIARQRPLWILDPVSHVVRRIVDVAGDVGPRADPMQGWADIAFGAGNAGNIVTAAALVLLDEVGATTRVAAEVIRARSLAGGGSGSQECSD